MNIPVSAYPAPAQPKPHSSYEFAEIGVDLAMATFLGAMKELELMQGLIETSPLVNILVLLNDNYTLKIHIHHVHYKFQDYQRELIV